MGYRYPNLLVGTRSNPLSFYTIDKILVGMRMRFMLVEGRSRTRGHLRMGRCGRR
jgi:hypothetical protein